MDLIIDGVRQAVTLALAGDPEVLGVILLSLQVSLAATALSLVVGLPLGATLAFSRFPGRRLIISLINTGMGLPPVVVGLVVMLFLWRSGPFGSLGILYTPVAIIIAQFVIATPLVVGITLAALQQLDPRLRLQILALGASRAQCFWLLAREARLPLLAAVMAGFGAIISEVGASMLVGGNIKGQTRVLTTATVMEAGRGEFGLAIAWSAVLMLIIYLVNVVLTTVQQRERPR